MNSFEFFFGEDQGRYLIEVENKDLDKVKSILEKNSVYFEEFGKIQEKSITIKDKLNVTIDELTKENKSWLIEYMSN